MPVPGALQSVQRAEFLESHPGLAGLLAWAFGFDNLNVVRPIGRLLDNGGFSTSLLLVKDGDLVAVVQHMIQARGADTVKVTKVKGRATEADVDQGGVLEEDRLGDAEADSAADLERRHQPESGMDALRILLEVGTHWYPIVQQLHRFMIAVSRVTVNHDGRWDGA